jgi:hypothetical protein
VGERVRRDRGAHAAEALARAAALDPAVFYPDDVTDPYVVDASDDWQHPDRVG